MFKRFIYTLISIFVFYAIFASFILPIIIKSQATSYIKEQLNKELTIKKVSFNPFLFKLNFYDVVLKDKQETMVSFKNLLLDFDLDRTIANRYLHFKTLKLSKPFINILINEKKELNLLSLIPSLDEKDKKIKNRESKKNKSELLEAKLDSFSIEDAKIVFSNYSFKTPLLLTLDSMNYIVRDLNTKKGKVAAQTFFSTINKKSNLAFKGGLSLNPLKTYGNIELSNFKVALIWDLFKEELPYKLNEELLLNSKLGFAINLENKPTIVLNNSSLSLDKFHLKDEQNRTLLLLKRLALKDVNLNYPNIDKQSKNDLKIDSTILIDNSTLKSTALVDFDPLTAKVAFDLEALALNLLNPILLKSSYLKINLASLFAKGIANYENNYLNTTLDASLKQLHIDRLGQTIIKADEIKTASLVFNQKQNLLSIKSVDVKKPYAFVQIDQNGQLNLANFLKQKEHSSKIDKKLQKNREELAKSSALALNFGPLRIKNGSMTFEDMTLPIFFKIENHNISGYISQLNTKSTKPSVVKLNGSIGKYGNMKIDGELVHNDFKSYSDIKIDFDNIALSDLSGYSGKFLSRTIDDGKLALDLSYFIQKAKLEAKNNLVISKIKLGKKVQSKDSISLPLELAIAILENKDGIIDLKLPLKGDLNNPKFSVAPIIWQAFTNIITKAITAPFSLLGSLFGFKESEINSVPFYFAQANIESIQKEPLDKIAEILQNRTKLSIKLNPVYDEKNDTFALQTILFNTNIKELFNDVKVEDYESIYISYLEKNYNKYESNLSKIKKKYSQEGALNERLYKKELETTLIKKQKIATKKLEALAKKRVENIAKYLLEQKVAKEQIVVTKKIEKKSLNSKFSIVEISLDSLN